MIESDQPPEQLAAQARASGRKPPVESWNPAFTGDLDMRIDVNGEWFYRGRRLGRKAMTRLFASILRREDDGHYYLVTPVEKYRIQVEDVPFVAHSLRPEGSGRDQRLHLSTNLDAPVVVGPGNPLEVNLRGPEREPRPYVLVERKLYARLARADFYRLVDLATEEDRNGRPVWGVWSGGRFFPIDESPSGIARP